MSDSSSLTPQQVRMRRHFALIEEADAAASLLTHAGSILRNYRSATLDAEPLLACLASAVEKTLKLTVAGIAVDPQEGWPTAEDLQSRGHNIVALERQAMALIAENTVRSTVPGKVDRLLAIRRADPYLDELFLTLQRCAKSGRYHNLDLLSGRKVDAESPKRLWDGLLVRVSIDDSEILAKLASADGYDEGRTKVSGVLLRSLDRWRDLIAVSWSSGISGRPTVIARLVPDPLI